MSKTSIDAAAFVTTRCQSTANRCDEEALVTAFLADIQLAARVAGVSFEEWPFATNHGAILSSRIRSLESHKLHRLAALAEAAGYQSPQPDADIAGEGDEDRTVRPEPAAQQWSSPSAGV